MSTYQLCPPVCVTVTDRNSTDGNGTNITLSFIDKVKVKNRPNFLIMVKIDP